MYAMRIKGMMAQRQAVRMRQGTRGVARVSSRRSLGLNTSDLRCVCVIGAAVVSGHRLGIEGVWVNHAFVPCAIDEYVLGVYCVSFDSRVRVRGRCGGV